MKSLVLILIIALFQKNQAQYLWKSAGVNNPGYSVHRQEQNQRVIYGQPQLSNPTRYVQRSNSIHQSTFVPLKTLYEEEDLGKDKFATDLFFTIDEWPLHLETEDFQPEVIVDDFYDPLRSVNRHQHSHAPDVVSIEKTHFSLGPGNIKEEQTYFNNKDGQVHAIHHTVEATIQGFDNKTIENPVLKSSPNSKSEFTEETILINPSAKDGDHYEIVRDEATTEDGPPEEEPKYMDSSPKLGNEESLIPNNVTET